jgi:hypothetical protein
MIISFIGAVGIVAELMGYGLPNMPLWAWLIVMFLGFSIAQFLAFHKVRNERQNLKSRFETDKSRKQTGSALADFHSEAEELISRQITDENQLVQWLKDVTGWNTKVTSFLSSNVSPVDARIFSLVVVNGVNAKTKWKHQYNNEHKEQLHYLNNRLQKLAEIMSKYQ